MNIGKCYPKFYRHDLHRCKNIYYIEVIGRLYPQQYEYFKTNNVSVLDRIEENLMRLNLDYRVYLIEIVKIESVETVNRRK